MTQECHHNKKNSFQSSSLQKSNCRVGMGFLPSWFIGILGFLPIRKYAPQIPTRHVFQSFHCLRSSSEPKGAIHLYMPARTIQNSFFWSILQKNGQFWTLCGAVCCTDAACVVQTVSFELCIEQSDLSGIDTKMIFAQKVSDYTTPEFANNGLPWRLWRHVTCYAHVPFLKVESGRSAIPCENLRVSLREKLYMVVLPDAQSKRNF